MTREALEALIDAEQDVVGVDATGLDLRRLVGTYAHFFASTFRGADLTAATFYGASFERCDFTGARLAGVEAGSATFRACTFDDADLSGIALNGATFDSPRSNACFFGALGEAGGIPEVPDVIGRDTMIGPIRIESEVASSTSNAIFTGVTTIARPTRVLVTVGPRQRRPIIHVNADLHYWVSGVAPMVAAVEVSAPSLVRHVCVEEHPDGVALADLVARSRPVERDAISILTQLAAIVVAGHEKRWKIWGVHPRLCFVDGTRVTGIAGHTMRFLIGMPPLRDGLCLDPYLPIEVWRGDDVEPVDDVFALCALGYFLVTGASPFAAPTFDQQLSVIASGAYPRLPGPLGHVLARGLVADREARASSADLLAALKAL